MQKKRRSLLLDGAERIADALWKRGSESRILGAIANGYVSLEERLQNSFFLGHPIASMREIRPSRLCRKSLLEGEKSVFFSMLSRMGSYFADTSMITVGVFLLFYGGGTLLASFLFPSFAFSVGGKILPLLFVLASIFAFLSRRSMAYALSHSLFFSWFLFDVCGFSGEVEYRSEKGAEHIPNAIITALVLLLFGFWIPFPLTLLPVAVLLALCLIVQTPELLAVGALTFVPFFSLLPHPTYVLLCIFVLFEIAWLWKILCGKRLFWIGARECLILLFGVLFLTGGWIGAGGRHGLLYGGVLFLLLLTFFPMQSLLLRPIWRKRVLYGAEFGGAVCSFIGILQYFFGDLTLKWVDPDRFSDIGARVTGTFSNPNFLAVYLLLLLPSSFAECFDEDAPRHRRFFFFGVFCIEGLCLILTFTRGAWIGAIAALLVFLLLGSRRTCGILLLLPCFLLPLIPYLPQRVVHRFGSIGAATDSSVRYRFYTWRGVLRMIGEHPFGIGCGEAAFSSIYPHYAISGTESVMHAHQLYLQIFLELGIFGLLVFCLVIASLFLTLVRGCTVLRGRVRLEMLGAACGVLGVLVMGCFDHVWYHSGLFCLFWCLCACMTAPLIQWESEGGENRVSFSKKSIR